MGAHLIFLGPSTAGKTSLMLGLQSMESDYNFTVDRTWTTRERRPNETDDENIFVDHDKFMANRPNFLFTFSTFPTYEYGIVAPAPVADKEVRMRILMPRFAQKFRQLVQEPALLCSVSPFDSSPEGIFRARDPGVNPEDLQARMQRFQADKLEADALADIHFQNTEGLDQALRGLGSLVLRNLNLAREQ